MRITKKNLRKLIREEVFDQTSFPYRVGDEIEIRDSGRGTTFWARVVKPLKNGVRIKDESGWVGTVKYQDVMPSKLVQKTMDVNIMPEGGAMGRYEPQKRRTYNQVSDSTKAMANAVKRKFLKLYDAEVKIDGRAGWITVNGKKAVNISSASGSPTSMEDMLSQMEDSMWGNQVHEGILKEEMLKIIANTHSPETEIFNRIANYALTNDIAGAMADKEVNTDELYWELDEMRPWVNRVGGKEQWCDDDCVVPDNWDAEAVYDFMEDLERAWHDDQAKKDHAAIAADPDKGWLEFMGDEWSSTITPNDLETLGWKEYKKYIRLSPPASISHGMGEIHITNDDIESHSPGTRQDFVDFLTKRAGKTLKKRKIYKSPPPLYDHHYIREGLTEAVTDDEFVKALRDVWDAVRIDVDIRNPTSEDKADEAMAMFGTYEPKLADQFNALKFKDQDMLLRLAFDDQNFYGKMY